MTSQLESLRDRVNALTRPFADKSRKGMQRFVARRDEVRELLDAIVAEQAAIKEKVESGELTRQALDNLTPIWERASVMVNTISNTYAAELLNSCPDDALRDQLKVVSRERSENQKRIHDLTAELQETGRLLDNGRKVLASLGGEDTLAKILDLVTRRHRTNEFNFAKRNVSSLEGDGARCRDLLVEARQRQTELAEQVEAVKASMRLA